MRITEAGLKRMIRRILRESHMPGSKVDVEKEKDKLVFLYTHSIMGCLVWKGVREEFVKLASGNKKASDGSGMERYFMPEDYADVLARIDAHMNNNR